MLGNGEEFGVAGDWLKVARMKLETEDGLRLCWALNNPLKMRTELEPCLLLHSTCQTPRATVSVKPFRAGVPNHRAEDWCRSLGC